jgi:hypothetical protein
MEGGVLNVELPRSRSVLTPCFNGSKLSELHRHLHFQNTTHTSNQYNFDKSPACREAGGCSKQPEVVAQDNQPSCPEPPEQSPPPNKKQRTISDVDFFPTNPPQTPDKSPINSHIFPSREQLEPTEKQNTCPHPASEIVILPDNITVCNHCYGLLDDNLKLQEKETPSVEIVAA